MPEYQFYNLEQNGKVVISRIHLTCATDDIAIEHGQKLSFGETVQVWQEDRCHPCNRERSARSSHIKAVARSKT
jgi:hypothetical protein